MFKVYSQYYPTRNPFVAVIDAEDSENGFPYEVSGMAFLDSGHVSSIEIDETYSLQKGIDPPDIMDEKAWFAKHYDDVSDGLTEGYDEREEDAWAAGDAEYDAMRDEGLL